jgi:hypothetical protein
VANPVSCSTTANEVVWGRTSTEVNLFSRILHRIGLAEPKAKSKKMSLTDPVKEEEKPRPRLRQNRGLKRKKKTLGRLQPRTSAIHTYYHTVLLSLMIFHVRWMTQVFQPSLI